MYARPRPRFGVRRTRAPPASASSVVRSLPLSMIRISPTTPAFFIPSWHQATKSAIVSCSFNAGMTIDSSGSATSLAGSRSSTSGSTSAAGTRFTAGEGGAVTSSPLSCRGSSPASTGAAPRAWSARSASRARGCGAVSRRTIGHVPLPAPVAAGVGEDDPFLGQADALDRQRGDLGDRDVVAGRHVVGGERRGRLVVRGQARRARCRSRGRTTSTGCRRPGSGA